MHYLFFLIVGKLDVDMCVFTIYGIPFININITQLCTQTTSEFDNRLWQNNDKFNKKLEFPNPSLH